MGATHISIRSYFRVSSMMVEMPGLVKTDSQCVPSRQKVKPIPRTCNETNKKTIAFSGRGISTIIEYPGTKLTVFTGKGKDNLKFYLFLFTGHNRYRCFFKNSHPSPASTSFLRILSAGSSVSRVSQWVPSVLLEIVREEKLFSLYITGTSFSSSVDKFIRAKCLPLWPL